MMRNPSVKRFKAVVMCVLALVAVVASWYVYRWSVAKPKCNCMFPQSKRYGVVGRGGTCRVVDCEIPTNQPSNP